ncbi:uncharacterized protein LOC110445432 isoform X2 [Mizuhopecten yessoensis]|uniref:uncharacterized protein LOC110445432 isoform X2 n=1 Tax=Mizuhopecten yessoensis TaxID=6573 RepID=UPI000B45DB0C|nr:uncharacterized protein LOC110445432 isoform X2 [Mizuhopecten yessoensis]
MADPQTYADAMRRLEGSGRKLGSHNFPGAVRHDGSLIMTQNMWIEFANMESKNARTMALPRGRGIDTIFVIDISASMLGEPFEKATNFILTFLDMIENINSRHRLSENVALVTVGHKTEVLHHLTSDYRALRTKLGSIQVEGRTPMMAGLFMALSAINGRGSITVMNGVHVHPRIIVLTDAKFTDSESTTGQESSMYDQQEIDDEIFQLAARLGTEHHSIHCVNVGDVENPDILAKIAQVTDGSVIGYDAGSVKKLGRHFKNMAAVTRMRRNFPLSWKDRENLESVVKSYESDVEQTDIDDMMAMLQYKLTDPVEEDREYLDGSAPALGTRVVRGPHWTNNIEDGEGPGTIVQHSRKQGSVTVEWDLTRVRGEYSYQEGKKQIVISHVQRLLMDDDLIAPGCLVCRGDDWQWGFQDGGPENVGVVYDVQQNGLVHVRWPNGHCNWYRFGAEGMFDVRIWEPSDSQNEFGAQSKPFNSENTVLPPKSQVVTSATSLQNKPSHTTPVNDVPETGARGRTAPSNTTVTTPISDGPVTGARGPAAPSYTTATTPISDVPVTDDPGPGPERKHVLPPNTTPMSTTCQPVQDTSTRGPQTNQAHSDGPKSLSDQRDLSIDHASLKGNGDTIEVTSDAKEDIVYTQEDVEWCWYDKKQDKWITFSEANTIILEEEKKKNRKKGCKNVKINDIWFRVYLSTMRLQKVNSRESTKVKRAVVPRVIKGMRKELVDKYMKLLARGSYPSSNIRLMVVGNDRVGKTSLCRNMLKDEKFGNTDGTDGIDVFVNSYQINTATKKRKKLGVTEHVIAMQKLACATAYGKPRTEEEEEEEMPEEEEQQPEETDSVPHFPPQMSIEQPATLPVTPTPATELENSIEQININQPIIFSETTHPIISNYVVGKHTGEISIPEYVKRDVDYILDEAGKLQTAGTGTEQGDIAYLSMWDFGGEKIFYDSHHIFLSKDAVYLLCFDVKKLQEDQDLEPILFWLRSIATYSECTGKSKGPPVILIGTHTDQMDGTEEEKEVKFQEICARITANADVQPIKSLIMNYFCVDNNKENDAKFDNILDAVIEAAEYQSQWKMDVPTKWLALEREIMKVKKDKVKTFEEIVKMDGKMEAPIKDEEEIRMFLR